MSKRQMQKMLRLMASGEPVELTSPMASVKKLARLAFVAQQFGYEYADVRQSSGRNGALTMLILPDPSPQARARACGLGSGRISMVSAPLRPLLCRTSAYS